jgi:hypothetical protein
MSPEWFVVAMVTLAAFIGWACDKTPPSGGATC